MQSRTLSVCLLALAAALPLSAAAQAQQTHHEADRVTSAVDTQQRHMLHGHLPGWAISAGDLGAVATDVALDHLTVMLARSAATQAAFEELLADQQNPASPRYQQWLTPQQIGEEFGPTDHDVTAVTQWLASEGLRTDAVSPDRMRITFSGASGAVGRALGTEFHRYKVHTREGDAERLSINNEPAIPATLTPVITGFHGLSEERREPQSIPVAVPAQTSALGSLLQPELTATDGSHFLAPADLVTIFDIQSVYNAGINGSGVKVAVIGRSRVLASDITAFQTTTGLSSTAQPVVKIPTTGTDPGIASGDQSEQTLDVNRVMGTATGAETDLVVSASSPTTDGIDIADEYEVDTLMDPIMSISYGSCEASANQSDANFLNGLFSTAAGEGITTFISSGDSAAAGCVMTQSVPPATTPVASINVLCSSQYVVCVGGTEFNDTASPSTYWRSSNGTNLESAISYIPEGAWNEPTSGGAFQISGTGGGVSQFITKPSWQTGIGVPSDGARDVPDISFPSAAHDAYYICLNGSCVNNGNGSFSFSGIAGTSAAAPGLAGVMALVVQKLGGKAQGNFNPTLYRLAATTTLNVFHDTTPASSGVGSSCSILTASMCNNSTAGQHALTGGLAGYAVTTGYDLATGWGSVDVANLITAVVTPYVTPTVSLTGTASTIAAGGSDSFTATVTGTPGTPSGTIRFFDGSIALGAAVTLTAGASGSSTATLSGQAFTTAGTHNITAQYSGDTVFIAATSPVFTLTVNPAASSVTLTTSTTTLLVGQSPTLTATVNGSSAIPTGTMQFLANNVNFGSPVTLVNGVATLSTQSFATAGSYTVKAQYSGDANYAAATSNTITILVSASGSSPFYSLTPGSGTLVLAAAGATTGNTYTVTATSMNSFAGTVPLSCAVTFLGSGTPTDLPTCALSPPSVVLAANGTATSVVTITTTLPHGAGNGSSAKLLLGMGSALACMLLWLPLGVRGRSRVSLLVALLAVLTLGGLSGCGSGIHSSAATNSGTTPGNYTVAVTGTFSGAATATSFTLTVN